MTTTGNQNIAVKQGAEDSGRYFRYMAEFVGFTPDDADTILQTRPLVEKHLPEIVAKFYTHLLRYPPTRQWFLREDGTIDQEYLELRMRHLTNFWLRTASGVFDDEYARYVDYVGRAHTSHGADPKIYIAERYVIGQVGFVQHAISEIMSKELLSVDQDLFFRAEEAWDKLMMVLLEMLSRAYNVERTAEPYDKLLPVDRSAVERLADEAFEREHGDARPSAYKKVPVARVADIADGERRIVQVGNLSIGVFHHKGTWYALRNSCLHRGGPVCTGTLIDDTLTCPWHGFQYDVTTGRMLADPDARLDSYPIVIEGDSIVLQIPDMSTPSSASSEATKATSLPEVKVEAPPSAVLEATEATSLPEVKVEAPPSVSVKPELADHEFFIGDVPPGKIGLVEVDDEEVAVYNVGGTFCATHNACPHAEGPLNQGTLAGNVVTCPWHGSKFDVCTGAVVRGPAKEAVKTYRVTVEGEIGRVEAD